MFNFTEGQANLPLYNSQCETSLGEYSPYIHPDESLKLTVPCNKLNTSIVSCRNYQKKEFINEVEGLDFFTVKPKKSEVEDLPNFIPIVSKDFFNFDSIFFPYEYVGISLKDILITPPSICAGRLHTTKELKINERLLESPFFQGKKVILFSTGSDTLIEKLWQDSIKMDYFQKIGSMGFYLVTAMNFSVFWNECPLGHAINLKKSLATFSETEKYNTNSVPHVYWANEFHLKRWVDWLNHYPGKKYITVNCQMYNKASPSFSHLIKAGLQFLLENVSELSIILEGPPLKLLNDIKSNSQNIHIAIKTPNANAMCSQKLKVVSDKIVKNWSGESKRSLLLENFQTYENYVNDHFWGNFKINIEKLKKYYVKEKCSYYPSPQRMGSH